MHGAFPLRSLAAVLLLCACAGRSATHRDGEEGIFADGDAARGTGRGRGPNVTVQFQENSPAAPPRVLRVNARAGQLELQRGDQPAERLRVQPSEVAVLVEIVTGPGYRMLRGRYGATQAALGEPPPATYLVAVSEGREQWSVTAEKDSPEQPATLRAAIGELLRLRRLVEQLGR